MSIILLLPEYSESLITTSLAVLTVPAGYKESHLPSPGWLSNHSGSLMASGLHAANCVAAGPTSFVSCKKSPTQAAAVAPKKWRCDVAAMRASAKTLKIQSRALIVHPQDYPLRANLPLKAAHRYGTMDGPSGLLWDFYRNQSTASIFFNLMTRRQSSFVMSSRKCCLRRSMDLREMRLTKASCICIIQ